MFCSSHGPLRLKAEEERQKREEEKARRDYIKNEFLRRKQLKLFEDMEGVIKPRPASFKKKPRPKSMHRDIMESPKPPIKATGMSVWRKIYPLTSPADEACEEFFLVFGGWASGVGALASDTELVQN